MAREGDSNTVTLNSSVENLGLLTCNLCELAESENFFDQ